eukprot:TRINITY_DN40141_c0_g3_i1.p1 TRINITY_DN40141_c0_g3~~TRINITY_DN40141_c0_g3_i1.p1  ORF type:complete len:101 (+),score=3.85 TRINITY_DN40141_c0_g3_i1:173-475(+)
MAIESDSAHDSLIPAALRSARKRAGLSLTVIADRVSLSHQHLSAIETGSARGTSIQLIERVARELGYVLVLVPEQHAADARQLGRLRPDQVLILKSPRPK